MQMFICPRCGSSEIERDAFAKYDVGLQKWVLSGVLDHMACSKCDEDNIVEVKIERKEK